MSGFTSQEQWGTQYLIAVLDRAELQHYLGAAAVDMLSDADMQDIAQAMQEELNDLGFWEHLACIARCKLVEKGLSLDNEIQCSEQTGATSTSTTADTAGAKAAADMRTT